jgi:cardiolipin synthase
LTCHADAAVLSIQESEGLKEECLPPANIRLLVDGTQALSALEELLTRATQQIDVIMFMWEDDEVGRRVADLLSSKAKSGVRVRVLIDGGGNCIFGQPEEAPVGQINHAVCALAQQPGISVLRIHNPFGRFDHRKLVLADGQIAWSGGRNFVERAFFIQHDLSFTLAGPPVGQLQHLFNKCWRQQGGAESASNPGRGMEHRTECPLEGSSNARVRLLVTEPGSHQLGACLYRAVDSARHRIYLENVYLNDSLLVYKLARARQRGVDVRVVLTLVSPTKAINWANRVTANRLLKEGVRVYIYPTMTHVKAALVDDSWAYLGTANFDALSLRHNYELGFAIEAGSLIGEIEERLFLPDCCSEWELKRPLTVSLKDYACELVASLCL